VHENDAAKAVDDAWTDRDVDPRIAIEAVPSTVEVRPIMPCPKAQPVDVLPASMYRGVAWSQAEGKWWAEIEDAGSCAPLLLLLLLRSFFYAALPCCFSSNHGLLLTPRYLLLLMTTTTYYYL